MSHVPIARERLEDLHVVGAGVHQFGGRDGAVERVRRGGRAGRRSDTCGRRAGLRPCGAAAVGLCAALPRVPRRAPSRLSRPAGSAAVDAVPLSAPEGPPASDPPPQAARVRTPEIATALHVRLCRTAPTPGTPCSGRLGLSPTLGNGVPRTAPAAGPQREDTPGAGRARQRGRTLSKPQKGRRTSGTVRPPPGSW